MARVAVVTDATCDLPLDLAESLDLRIVPLTVTFGDDTFISPYEIDSASFYDKLRSSTRAPTTSQPSPVWFEEAYADAADDGAEAVVSIHLSSDLSGTCQLAQQVAPKARLPVTVVDSRQVDGALALAVLAALRAADAGADAADVAAVAREVAAGARTFFVVDTLEYLRRGGRLTGAQAVIGGALKVKPILTVTDGAVVALAKVRTTARALERLAELAVEHAAGRPVDLVVAHSFAPDQARQVRARIEEQVEVRDRHETEIGPVLGAHAGPGAVGVAVAPATT